MRKLIFLLSLIAIPTQAEVYKCTEKYGKTIYQNSPCKSSARAEQLDIQAVDPEQEAKALSKLEAIRGEYEARKAAQAESEKADAKRRAEAAVLEFSRRNAAAQIEQAEAQQRQASAMEQQSIRANQPVYYIQQPAPTSATTPNAPARLSTPAVPSSATIR